MGYRIQMNAVPCDGRHISMQGTSDPPGPAQAVFPGPAGTSEVVVVYYA
jgi:hypothetical protein